MSKEVRALKCPCLHIWPLCQTQDSFLITFFLASVKRSPPAWPWVVLGTNRTESSLGGGEVGAQGAEETGYFSIFQSNEKASRMGSDVSYRICFLCFHGG